MPKNKLQDVVFTLIMATIMVYGMIVYNVALNFPMAILYQMFYCGPLVRFIFRRIFREK